MAGGAEQQAQCGGNAGRHLLWVDPARDLVLASHWTEDPLGLIKDVTRVTPSPPST